ncbi:DNA topoisomerase 1 [Desulfosarcina ovata subsp. sediminis]|uniref:DNA topoisomerase 1 n=1 Tax=Desulfosarcina ovata subsp. sediminis TaxID=885957 RepID=A0A5K7ZPL4_9BACT|nr:type I DNA topoisomerase [Desulfosarcina ovata]BBO81769.1 DNA topoisomerase 1 [Desulfosarcina ovata subsp. sediminis]
MSKPLVIVESPTKVRTIKKYLGNDYNVAATVGHIKDLPSKNLGIDIEKDFTPQYRTIPGKSKVLSQLKSAAGDTTDIYLAPDPDREGEAIAWHTAEVLKKKGRRFHRVLFHELTKKAILESMQAAQELDRNKYEAQQARRILDRLVGYQISPLLWRKVKGGLSAGRVQSVSVRIICDRERAIQAFEPVEYWSITANLKGSHPPAFDAKLVRKNGKKIQIPDETTATAILRDLENAPFVLDKIVKRTTRRNPLPPFITSKLQQEAIRKLRFSAKKAMMIAQQLYEGIDLGPGEPVGLITYMRTDSTRIADEAAQEALQLITERFGPNYSNGKPRFFKNKNKAQDAHEAIRPTSVYHTPEKLKPYLSKDQMALYTMIWQRFMASQMAQALIDQKTLSIVAGGYTFTASGSSVKFAGFLAVYQSADDDAERSKGSQTLPELEEKSVLTPLGIVPKQHFTQPPPRFSEASLVKELEENGIGRPSTYAAILSTIRDKGYVELLKGYFRPTELGFIVNDLLIASFPEILDVEFTARMESDLDRVEQAEVESLAILNQFYGPFSKKLAEAVEGMLSVKGVGMPTGLTCPLCKKNPLRIKMGKNGHFLACSGYPECTYSSDYERDEKGVIAPVAPVQSEATDKVCDKCGKPMVIKRGRYGDFLACSGYPECKHTQSLNGGGNAKATGVPCPQPGCDGEIVEKSSKRGKIFYGCNRYPECSFASWDKPVAKACPACGNAYMVEKTTKRDGTMIVCPNRECKYKQPAGEGDGK